MAKLIKAARMALNVRAAKCTSGWRWQSYIDF